MYKMDGRWSLNARVLVYFTNANILVCIILFFMNNYINVEHFDLLYFLLRMDFIQNHIALLANVFFFHKKVAQAIEKAIKQEVKNQADLYSTFEEVPEFFQKCYKANKELRRAIQEKVKNFPDSNKCIALIGKTGVGKSCLFEYLLGEPIKQVKVIRGWGFHLESTKKTPEEQLIFNGALSGTLLPNIQQLDNGPHLIDLPGFYDNKGETEQFLNSLRIYETLKHYEQVKFVCVIKYANLDFNQRQDCFNITTFVQMLQKVCQQGGYKAEKQLFIVSFVPQDFQDSNQDEICAELEQELDNLYDKDSGYFQKIGEDYELLKSCFKNRQFYFLIPGKGQHPYQEKNLAGLKGILQIQPYLINELKKDSLLITKELHDHLVNQTKQLVELLKFKQRSILEIVRNKFEQFKQKIDVKKDELNHEERSEALMYYTLNLQLTRLLETKDDFSLASKYIVRLFKRFWKLYKDLDKKKIEEIRVIYKVLEDLHLGSINKDIVCEGLDAMNLILQKNFIAQYLQEKWKISPQDLEKVHIEEIDQIIAEVNETTKCCKLKIEVYTKFYQQLELATSQDSLQSYDNMSNELNKISNSLIPCLTKNLEQKLITMENDLDLFSFNYSKEKISSQTLDNLVNHVQLYLPKIAQTCQLLDNEDLNTRFNILKKRLSILAMFTAESMKLDDIIQEIRQIYLSEMQDYINYLKLYNQGIFSRIWNIDKLRSSEFNKRYNAFMAGIKKTMKLLKNIERPLKSLNSYSIADDKGQLMILNM